MTKMTRTVTAFLMGGLALAAMSSGAAAEIATNALTPNALTPNALTPNALTPNALSPTHSPRMRSRLTLSLRMRSRPTHSPRMDKGPYLPSTFPPQLRASSSATARLWCCAKALRATGVTAGGALSRSEVNS